MADITARTPQTPASRTAYFADSHWMTDARASFDVVAHLRLALDPDWTVDREVDPKGEVSVIVAAKDDDPDSPIYLLYEEYGCAQVATVRHERWMGRTTFATCRRAVAAIVAAASNNERVRYASRA